MNSPALKSPGRLADIQGDNQQPKDLPMKNKISPVAHERVMRDEDFIVSKTDAKGRITYSNRIFSEFAGYPEQQLLGVQHNIVRHPDMPRAVFQMMWETLHAGREFFGYVKNMASDGSYYWTFANVTATLNQRGDTVGYFSVRRKPRPDAVAYLAPVYADMLAREKQVGPKAAIETSRKVLQECYQSKGETYDQFIVAL
jgi:PAS domain S-box-containing protein